MDKKTIGLIISLLDAASFCASAEGLGCDEFVAEDDTVTAQSIAITSADIFDESDPKSKWLHRTANRLHINTRGSLIEDRLPFAAGDKLKATDLAEAERVIRGLPYIRDARVAAECETDGNAKVKVTAWDKWSLLPNLSFSRAGGKSQALIGIAEANLFGRGINTELNYITGDLRDGYQAGLNMPLTAVKHGSIGGLVGDNDDGHIYRLAFAKPFYELDGRSMYQAVGQLEQREDEIFQNGRTVDVFDHDIEFLQFGTGWSRGLQNAAVWRWTAGITIDRHAFATTVDSRSLRLPLDREFVYPWLGVQYLQNKYAVMSDIFLFSQREDIHLGWAHSLNIGIETNDLDDSDTPGVHINWSSGKAWRWQQDVFRLAMAGQSILHTAQRDFYNVSASLQAFHRVSGNWTLFARAALTASEHNFLDRPVTLGGENGVRGYPFQYQHGDKRWNASIESRFYPRIDFYQLFELAWVIFADAGEAYDSSRRENERQSALGSVGLGARIFGPRFTGNNVVHIDIAHPLTSGTDVPDWEWSVSVRRQF